MVKIHSTAINDWDWSLVQGKPGVYRLIFGLFKPKNPIPGIELAGTIEELGGQVDEFQIGDRVYGDISGHGWGTFAEYAAVEIDSLTKIPDKMSFNQAAALPHAAMLAWQGLVDVGEIKKGQKVLINGAGGGMGVLAIQIAKTFEANITGVDSSEKLELMKSLGCDRVIDFRGADCTNLGETYDLILDAKTKRPPRHFLRCLREGGSYVTIGGDLWRLFQLVWARAMGKKNLHIVSLRPNKDNDQINDLFVDGKLAPVIDGPYALEEVPILIRYFGKGSHKGKIVIQIA